MIVTRFPEVPETVNVVTVVVVPEAKVSEWATEDTNFRSVNVFDPVIVLVPPPEPRSNHRLPYVLPPPAKVYVTAPEPLNFIVPVVAVTVKPVDVPQLNGVPLDVTVSVPLPSVKVLVLLFDEENVVTDTLWPFRSRVPLVRVSVDVDVKLSCNVSVPVAESTIIAATNGTPDSVRVNDPRPA